MSLPLEHLSASSISLFQRCPRQFQEVYIRGTPRSSNSSLVVGSAVHLGLSRILKGEEAGSFFRDTVDAITEPIEWKESESAAKKWAEQMLYTYYESVGQFLDVLQTEKEILIEIPGIDIPVLGYVDITTKTGIIDVKTTRYFQRKPELNPEWKLQMNIYQLENPQHGEFHVLTRSKSDPLVTPMGRSDPLFIPVPSVDVSSFVERTYKVMEYYYETWGAETDWPGNLVHPWAAKYCPLGESCCQKA